VAESGLLGAAAVRELAAQLGIRPTKRLGQNFVIDANTVRKIVRESQVDSTDIVVEVGPGLGSLTLELVRVCRRVYAVEIDPVLAQALPATVDTHLPGTAERLLVVQADALTLDELAQSPTAFVANLPYNVAVPVLLHLLAVFDSLRKGLVMVQLEVADRLAAAPGSRVYGVPSVKAAWYAEVKSAGRVGRNVFWPVPNVDSGLVSFRRREPPQTTATRAEVFEVIDVAFAQRRKSLRSALSRWAGSAAAADQALREAGIDPGLRGERLTVDEFAALAAHRPPNSS
jgi:16S rRNA (adenine1518-N6/adenine1519-N6)-dimethyltransferase